MRSDKSFELPLELQEKFRQAQWLEWITIGYLATVVALMVLVAGSSQSMKTAWIEDLLSMLPAIAFLVASRLYNKRPDAVFPYGYHRVFAISFLTSAAALTTIGGYLAIDSIIALIRHEQVTIETVQIFGMQVWMGWLMIAVLIYSAVPAYFLGKWKLPLAGELHNKCLHTDASTQKADYLTAGGAVIGVIGISLGHSWVDAAAALCISLSVIYDGVMHLKTAVLDLIDSHPTHTVSGKLDSLVEETQNYVRTWPWVRDARVRFREQGQVYFGEIWVTVAYTDHLPEKLADGVKRLHSFHWKLHDVVIMPVPELPPIANPEDAGPGTSPDLVGHVTAS